MKNLLLIAVVVLGSACVKLKGDMTVKEHLVYRKNGSARILLAGEYAAKAKLKGKRTVSLKMENAFEKKSITLKLPKDMSLPTDNGTFNVEAQALNQPFNLAGDLQTEVKTGDLVTEDEMCWIYDNFSCNGPFYGAGGYPGYGPVGGYGYCGSRRVPGQREVRYRNVTTTRTLNLDLVQDAAVKATFKGADQESKKKYEFRGVCRY